MIDGVVVLAGVDMVFWCDFLDMLITCDLSRKRTVFGVVDDNGRG